MSKLPSLDGIPERQAMGVVVGLIESLTPQPFPTEPPDADLAQQVLKELVESEGLADNAVETDQGKARLLEALSDRIAEPLKEGATAQDAKERLWLRGLLAPRQYEVVFPASVDSYLVINDARKNHLERAIRSPSMVQHLQPDLEAAEETAVTLFVQRHTVQGNTASLLVVAIRERNKIRVDAAWRVFDSDVPGAAYASSPLDLLKAFVAKYGGPFSVYGGPPRSFMEHETQRVIDPNALPMQPLERREGRYVGTMRFKVSKLGVVVVALGYQIFLPPFIEDLKRHGVAARVPDH